MRYLAFDIECANNFNGIGKICEFGYVISDENFNILEKECIIMDPEDVFDLGPSWKRLKLGFAESYYHYQKSLPYFADKINKLLSQEDVRIIGHAVSNDIGFLFTDFDSYELKVVDYVAYDTQIFYNLLHYNEYIKNINLEEAYNTLVPLKERMRVHAHKADDDALMTLEVLKYIMKELSLDLDGLVELAPEGKISSAEYIEKTYFSEEEQEN